jgi:hypothetical protein
MESLNLNTLVNSLPNAQQNAEKELLNDFKAAALSITTLYRSSRKNSKRAYNAGYATACQDLLNFIQQGVSASDIGPSPDIEGGGMTIGKVMDWTEARVDAIKAREEEEEEDEEREKDKERRAPSAAPSVAVHVAPKSEVSKPGAQHRSAHRPKDTTISLPIPHSPGCHPNIQSPSEPSSPSPPPTHVQRTVIRKHRLAPTREAFQLTTQSTNVHPSSTEHFPSSASSGTYPETPILIGAGAKRRHAVMMMLDSSSAPISIGDPSSVVSSPGPGSMNAGTYMGSTGSNLGKRRTRSSRNLSQIQSHNQNINVIQVSPEPMDIEEDSRERKRVARR